MNNTRKIGLYWIDENGYYHYPKQDQFEFGRMDAVANGELKKLDSRITDLAITSENEYRSGYEAGWNDNTAGAKAGAIAMIGLFGAIVAVTGICAYGAYKTEKLNKENNKKD